MSKTVRLIYPQWQGGCNPLYAEGSKIMAAIAPKSSIAETIEVPVADNYDAELTVSNGVHEEEAILQQTKAAVRILEDRQPDKVLVFGGDCSVSQAPFDYLHGKYPENTGIIWLDAHVDISKPTDRYKNDHAMVLANLMGGGAPTVSALVQHPFTPRQVLYAGVIADKMNPLEQEQYKMYRIPIVSPEALMESSSPVLEWIRENNIKNVMIHFDLDVLDAADFRSVFYNQPHLGPVSYATGKLTLAQTVRMITDIEKEANLVGLSIAEYAPWDIFNIREQFAKIDLFK